MVGEKGRCTVTVKRFTGDLLLSSTHAGTKIKVGEKQVKFILLQKSPKKILYSKIFFLVQIEMLLPPVCPHGHQLLFKDCDFVIK